MSTSPTCPQCQQPLPPDAPEGLCPACVMQNLAASAADSPTEIPPSVPGGSQPSPPLPDIGNPAEVAQRLPQFEIGELLGRGGMGVVYKAVQRPLDRTVALKILPPADALSPDFVERFRREARSLAKLSHPNIVTLYEFGESGGLYYFVMEFVDGANLREMIRSGKMKAEEALAVVPKICDALQFAHEEGVVHRDIKPENILVDKRGRVKIADFGLAKLLRREQTDQTLTMSGMTLGTPRYMAPEQLERPETVDHRADIYSLGVVFYEMLTGELPMGRFQPPSARSHGMQIDVRLDEIVLHALERDVERRYQHASEVRDDVEKVTSKPPVAPVNSAAPTAPTNPVAPPVESEIARRARASWFGRRSEHFRTLLPPVLVFLMLAFLLLGCLTSYRTVNPTRSVSAFGLPSPWLVSIATTQKHGVTTESWEFHPLTFSFLLVVLGVACPFLAKWLARIDSLVRYGCRFRDLRQDIQRRTKQKIFAAAAVAGLVPVLILALIAAQEHVGATHNYELRLEPHSKSYDQLLLNLPFSSLWEGGVEHYRRPSHWAMAIALQTKAGAEPVEMEIEMPSLKASYIPSWSKESYALPLVLDLDELTKWIRDSGGLDVQDENVKKDAAELMALLKQFSRQAPATLEESLNDCADFMPGFAVLGNSSNGNYHSTLGPKADWIELACVVVFFALYFVVAIPIQRAAFMLDREVRERGARHPGARSAAARAPQRSAGRRPRTRHPARGARRPGSPALARRRRVVGGHPAELHERNPPLQFRFPIKALPNHHDELHLRALRARW